MFIASIVFAAELIGAPQMLLCASSTGSGLEARMSYCEADLVTMKQVAKNYGFEASSLYAGSPFTPEAFLRKVSDMKMKKCPEYILYFTGMGSGTVDKATGDFVPCVLTSSSKLDASEGDLTVRQIESAAKSLSSEGAKVTVILDIGMGTQSLRLTEGKPEFVKFVPRDRDGKASASAQPEFDASLWQSDEKTTLICATALGKAAYAWRERDDLQYASVFTSIFDSAASAYACLKRPVGIHRLLDQTSADLSQFQSSGFLSGMEPNVFPPAGEPSRDSRWSNPWCQGAAQPLGFARSADIVGKLRDRASKLQVAIMPVAQAGGSSLEEVKRLKQELLTRLQEDTELAGLIQLRFLGTPDCIIEISKIENNVITYQVRGDLVTSVQEASAVSSSKAEVVKSLKSYLMREALIERLFNSPEALLKPESDMNVRFFDGQNSVTASFADGGPFGYLFAPASKGHVFALERAVRTGITHLIFPSYDLPDNSVTPASQPAAAIQVPLDPELLRVVDDGPGRVYTRLFFVPDSELNSRSQNLSFDEAAFSDEGEAAYLQSVLRLLESDSTWKWKELIYQTSPK